jgi:hypothetical protein
LPQSGSSGWGHDGKLLLRLPLQETFALGWIVIPLFYLLCPFGTLGGL